MAMNEQDMQAMEQEMMQGENRVKFMDPSQPDEQTPLSEEQEILLAQEGEGVDVATQMQSVNARVMGSSLPVPTKLLRMLPVMRRAAEDPSLPQSVRDMYRTTVLSIDERVRNQNGKA